MSGRKLAKRACDACKVRKIRCSETQPCDGCRSSKIECTYLKQAAQRGPRRLRDATLHEIRKAQDILQNQSQVARRGNSKSFNVTDPDPPPEPSTEVAHLVLYLCVYRVQLYPLWPVIKVERLIASLQSESPDVEVFALAYALAAATATRTQSTDLNISKSNEAQILEEKCQAARARVPKGRPPNLTSVRIAFFLHVYYDSLEMNSMKSMLYLREAVTIATMIGLHKESYYAEVPIQEREIRRRVLWLLFITERVIAALYEQPITLRTRIELPSTVDTDEADVLTGFQLLARAFWRLDEAGIFNLLDELEVGASPSSNGLTNRSQEMPDFSNIICSETARQGYVPSVQRLDLTISRCWLLVMNLRIYQMFGLVTTQNIRRHAGLIIDCSQEFLSIMSSSTRSIIEAHGPALQLKISTVLGTLSALIHDDLGEEDLHKRCLDLTAQIRHVLSEKGGKVPEQSLWELTPATRDTQTRTKQTAPSQESVSNYTGSFTRSPVGQVESFSSPDFTFGSNYEGLFDAVDRASGPSPRSIDELFSQSSLEHYRNFDDVWPPIQTPEAVTNIFPWAQQTSLHG